MDIDFSAVLKDFNGEDTVAPDENGKLAPVTLASVCINALHAVAEARPRAGGRELTGEDKLKRGLLARRIYKAAEIAQAPLSLKVEEIALLKTAVSDAYPSPRVVVGAFELLDPATISGQLS